MTRTLSTAASAVADEIDTSARGPLLLLLVAAFKWLVISGVLALIASIQLHTPSFLADCAFLTIGRTQAMQESAFVYGWGANAAFAIAIWILGRLGGGPLRGLGLLRIGTIFWNLGLLVGVICIGLGEGTGVPFLQLPAYVLPLLLVAYAAIATPGVLAWTGRLQATTFASQWYAVAALFLFPWLLSAAAVMLIGAPVRGVAQAVVAGWYAQNVLSLWLVPVALAAAYYLVPKLTGHTISHYDFASHGFWALLYFSAWTGGRHLIGGPVPAWIPTLAIAAQVLVLYHFIIVAMNLREGLGAKGPILSWISLGLVIYVLGGVIDTVFAFRGLAQVVQFTLFPAAQTKLALIGVFSLIAFGTIYHFVPRITGVVWPSPGLLKAHFAATLLGLLLTFLALSIAGWVHGEALNHNVSFAEIAASTKPWLLAATVGEALLLLGSLVVTVHFFRVFCATMPALTGTTDYRPSALEASAS